MSNQPKAFAEGLILIVFGVCMSALTVYGAAGIDPTQSPSREVTTAQRQLN